MLIKFLSVMVETVTMLGFLMYNKPLQKLHFITSHNWEITGVTEWPKMASLRVVLYPQGGLRISWMLPGLWRPKAQESRMCILLVKASQKASADQEKENSPSLDGLQNHIAKRHLE